MMIAPAKLPPPHPFTLEEQEEMDIYTANGIMEYFDDDEISIQEEGFMRGYLGA